MINNEAANLIEKIRPELLKAFSAIPKYGLCSICGMFCTKGRSEYHHYDYDSHKHEKAFCNACHESLDKILRIRKDRQTEKSLEVLRWF